MTKDKKQIYIVDDDISICRALSVLLSSYGFSVETFTSAEDFFRVVPKSARGCILLDIHMPGMGGWQALRRIVRSGSDQPSIIISADENGGLKERAVAAGAFGYLQKPFNDRELIDLIEASFEDGMKI